MQDDRRATIVIIAAAAILMVTMGVRQSMGLFVSPLNTTTGLGIATISLALAVGQFTGVRSSRSPARWPTATAPAPSCSPGS